jgi:hypothetical protein
MASFTMTDCRIEINSVVLSSYATSVTVSVDVDDQEDTAFGDTYKSRIGGLKDFKLDIEFNSDFAASAVDQTIWPLFGLTTTFKVRPLSSAITTTNPEYSGTVLVTEYSPLDGSVGDLATTKVSWPGAGGAGLARATT